MKRVTTAILLRGQITHSLTYVDNFPLCNSSGNEDLQNVTALPEISYKIEFTRLSGESLVQLHSCIHFASLTILAALSRHFRHCQQNLQATQNCSRSLQQGAQMKERSERECRERLSTAGKQDFLLSLFLDPIRQKKI